MPDQRPSPVPPRSVDDAYSQPVSVERGALVEAVVVLAGLASALDSAPRGHHLAVAVRELVDDLEDACSAIPEDERDPLASQWSNNIQEILSE